MQNGNAQLYFNGVPVEPDVKRLEEAFGVPEIGTLILHAQITTVIGSPRGSSRYYSVTRAWREGRR